ncbi:MAG TPA: TlpA disulfide reductase family protein [Phycisphaerales bacterium]|nr:TlpA disulfide reductase family protein [Phycisphaerales bacterium]
MMRMTWLAAAACTVLAVPALAQVNEDAKAVLNDSAKAIKEMKGVQFEVKTFATGMLKDIIDLSGTVKLWRPEGASTVTWRVDGRAKDPGKKDRAIHVMSDGNQVVWLDYTNNWRVSAPASDPGALEAANMCRELVMQDWLSPTPYSLELTQYPNLTKKGIATVGGEVCDVVEAMPATKDRNRTWSIGVKDRLPRSLELGTGNLEQKIAKVTELSGLKPMKFTQADFDIALPEGFVDHKVAAPVPMTPKAEPGVTPTKPVELGLKPGTAAPAFAAKDAAGNEVSLDSLKGNVVVMEFWGTMFKQSTAHTADMRALAGKVSKDKVKMVGVACRSDEKMATDWWNKSGPGYVLVPKGDAIASDYKVAGYPSYCVIDAKGNVAAFFQDFPGADKMMAAVEAATKE